MQFECFQMLSAGEAGLHLLLNQIICIQADDFASHNNQYNSQMRNLILLIIFIFSMFSFFKTTQAQCSLNFMLPNLLKDVFTLMYNNGDEQSYNYLYFPSMFSSSPKVAYSISQIDINTNLLIKYYLDMEQQSMQFVFYFNAPAQLWSKVTINLWITSRNDLIVSTTTLKNITPGQNASQTINLTSYTNTTITSTTKHLLFITGISATLINKNFNVNVTSGPTNAASATILVSNGLSTLIQNITVTSLIIQPTTSQFLSYIGSITYRSFSSQFFNLYSSFVPIYYYMVGINSFSLSGQSTRFFSYSMDLTNSTVLSLSIPQNNVNYDYIGFSYVSIGLPTASICSSCNTSYITDTNCQDFCPANTYPYNYPTGGKACLQCPSIVGLKLNDLGNGCSCLPGFELLTTYQCIAMSNIPTNCTGPNVIQNGTTCICSPGTYNISGLCQTCPNNTIFNGAQCVQSPTCPPNSTFNASSKLCVCSQGFMNISGICMQCPNGQYYNSQLQTCTCTMLNQMVGPNGTCICQPGYFNISNFCIQCPNGTQYINGSCTSTSCPQNQVLVNSKCICDSYSVKKGSACQKCGVGTFPDTTNNICSSCIPNCATCNNPRICQVCNLNYIFDFSSLSCIQVAGNTSSTVSITNGFPVITLTAFVIDFSINSPATLSSKTPQQLANMISIKYPQTQPKPYRTLYKQSPLLNKIRITFDYRCLLPVSSFVVSFGFLESSIALNSTLNVMFSSSSGQISLNFPNE